MGAEKQEAYLYASTPSALSRKFDLLCKQAAWDYGHSGYSGSFAEKDAVEIRPVPSGETFWDKDAANKDSDDNQDKWGPAFAYAVSKEKRMTQYLIIGWCSS